MKARYILLIFFVIIFISCRKQNAVPSPPQTIVLTDTPVLKLKDMTERGLPSPYYHFDYNDSGYIAKAAFAAGLSFYDLSYINKRMGEMAMNKDIPFNTKKDKLKYEYQNGNLTGINVFDQNGVLYRKCSLTFSTSRQLQQLKWDVKTDSPDFATELIMDFSYYRDGNLEKITYASSPVDSQPSAFYEDKFEDYDNKLNADGFTLLHANPFYLDFVLLPSVHLQLNNPRRVTHTGDGANYIVNYSYTYDAKGRPLEKRGDFVYTNGTNAGTHADLLTTFSYYD